MEQVVRSLPQAFRIIKEMRLYGDEESDYRSTARESLSWIPDERSDRSAPGGDGFTR